MKAHRLKWKHKNRTWEFADGSLIGDSIMFGFGNIIFKILRTASILIATRAMKEGCYLILSSNSKTNLYPFDRVRTDGTGAYYSNDDIGEGWLDCKSLGGCPETMYIGVVL
tara:strand:- start:6395 stop:6727 length:333 start_codon:yes stop_codon:yes gene_type:complete